MCPALTLLAAAAISACGGGTDDLVDVSANAAHEDALSLRSTAVESTDNWTKIAGEGGSFSVAASQRVRYGKDTKWVEKTVSGAGQCTNTFFGIDPAYGVTKQCQVQMDVTPPPSDTWTKIANEGGSFSVGTSQRVRYGKDTKWVEKTISGAWQCTNAFFGSDPAYGVTKQCDLFKADAPPPPPSGTWTKIANEGGSFSVDTSQRVRYGKGTTWVETTMSGAGQCTNGFFGIDPARGVTKQCDLFESDAPPPPPPPPGDPKYVPPIVISKGGTYSANWESQDPKVAAVTVSTTEPVVIENCRLRGKGHLVLALRDNTNITVRNCIGQGLNPNVVNTRTGRFVSVYKPGTLVVERNTMLGTAGIYADGAGASAKGITVRYNRAQNIEGRLSDGKGGYLSDFVRMQFVQFNNVRATKNIEVAWNQVINEIGKSRVEDNINIYLSSGTADSPMQIHDNYIQGAYPADPATPKFSGGGIIIDGGTSNLQQAAGFVRIHGNQVVSTTNYGIAIAAGHDIDIRDNRVVSSGMLPDGRRLAAANVGSYVSNGYGYPGTFFNNGVTTNTIGWINASGNLNNSWFPDCPGNACQGNAYMNGMVTVEMEAAEYTSWQQKLAAAGLKVGSSLEP